MQHTGRTSEIHPRAFWLGMLLCFAFAFMVRISHSQNEPITDELYHLLAAESWSSDGDFAIADGEYRRARLFTMLVGVVHRATGGDVDSIRWLCIAIGAALVAAVFGWTMLNAGRGAALVAGFLLATNPTAIFLSQYIRFYSLHALIFFLLAACCWSLHNGQAAQRRWLLAIGITLLTLAGLHLQVTTLVGVAGIVLWALFFKRHAILETIPSTTQRVWIAASLTLAILVIVFFTRGTIASLLETYRASALWNSSDNALYYFNLYRNELGVLWSLAPAAVVIAILARPAPALFCTFIFVTAFIIQSFGGMRSERFMFYALPWFFIPWGIAAAAIATTLRAALDSALAAQSFIRGKSGRQWMAPVASVSLIVVIAGFALLTMPSFETFARMSLGKATHPPEYWDRYRTNWHKAAPFLRQLDAEVAVTVASQPLHAIYYLNDVDYALNATTLADIAVPGIHSKMDPRTGRLVFDDVDTMRQIVACHPSGLVIIHEPAWRNATRVPDEVADFLQTELDPIPLTVKSDLLLFRWNQPLGEHPCPNTGL
jgi:hypothetical protein